MSMQLEVKPVLFGVERVGERGVGFVTLNRPEVLNSLNSSCYDLLENRLNAWAVDSEIALVVLQGAGEKAFCAGGDVKSLVLEGRTRGLEVAREFFTREYYVDQLIHNYPKPVLALMDGITMGGGLGLAVGASHRIVTERTLLAMPEISIGLFPDVGASHFLPKFAGGFGLWMGLTGARLTGLDARAAGLADYFLESLKRRKLFVDILRLPWSGRAESDRSLLTEYLNSLLNKSAESPRSALIAKLNELFLGLKDLTSVERVMRGLNKSDDKFIEESVARYDAGSWLAKAVFFAAVERHRGLSIGQTLEREWQMALSFSADTEFAEGVRAVLIDKDQKPNWRYKTLGEIEKASPNLDHYFNYCQRTKEPNLLSAKFRQL